jgi:hypothetical protein
VNIVQNHVQNHVENYVEAYDTNFNGYDTHSPAPAPVPVQSLQLLPGDISKLETFTTINLEELLTYLINEKHKLYMTIYCRTINNKTMFNMMNTKYKHILDIGESTLAKKYFIEKKFNKLKELSISSGNDTIINKLSSILVENSDKLEEYIKLIGVDKFCYKELICNDTCFDILKNNGLKSDMKMLSYKYCGLIVQTVGDFIVSHCVKANTIKFILDDNYKLNEDHLFTILFKKPLDTYSSNNYSQTSENALFLINILKDHNYKFESLIPNIYNTGIKGNNYDIIKTFDNAGYKYDQQWIYKYICQSKHFKFLEFCPKYCDPENVPKLIEIAMTLNNSTNDSYVKTDSESIKVSQKFVEFGYIIKYIPNYDYTNILVDFLTIYHVSVETIKDTRYVKSHKIFTQVMNARNNNVLSSMIYHGYDYKKNNKFTRHCIKHKILKYLDIEKCKYRLMVKSIETNDVDLFDKVKHSSLTRKLVSIALRSCDETIIKYVLEHNKFNVINIMKHNLSKKSRKMCGITITPSKTINDIEFLLKSTKYALVQKMIDTNFDKVVKYVDKDINFYNKVLILNKLPIKDIAKYNTINKQDIAKVVDFCSKYNLETQKILIKSQITEDDCIIDKTPITKNSLYKKCNNGHCVTGSNFNEMNINKCSYCESDYEKFIFVNE